MHRFTVRKEKGGDKYAQFKADFTVDKVSEILESTATTNKNYGNMLDYVIVEGFKKLVRDQAKNDSHVVEKILKTYGFEVEATHDLVNITKDEMDLLKANPELVKQLLAQAKGNE